MSIPDLSGRTGLMGGTFNPIHLGHLHVAQEVMLALGLDRVLLVPNRIPPHRSEENGLVDAEHRFAMAQLAAASNPRIFVSRVELDRPAPSFSVDTVEALRASDGGGELYFVTGADALMRYVWRDLDRLLSMLAAMVCVTRPGFDLALLKARLDSLGLAHRERVRSLEIPGYAVSSTEIRRRVAAGQPIRYMVTREVEDYIAKYGLYD